MKCFREDFVGENFIRFMGDTQKHAKAQLFAWDAYEKGVDVHLLAEPTKLEMLQKEYDKKKDQFKSQVQKDVLEKYGGEEHLDAPPKTLLLAQTEDYVEYSRYGTVIKGREKEIIRSRYEEDVYINNHTSVWGSYWQGGHWGYKCCHSYIKNSYCVGEAGFKLNEPPTDIISSEGTVKEEMTEEVISEIKEEKSGDSSSDSSSSEDERKKKKKLKKKKKKEKKRQKKLAKQSAGEKTLEDALKEEDKQQAEAARLLSMDERKRPYNSMFDVKKPTDEQMEAYLMKRRREEDPMKDFM